MTRFDFYYDVVCPYAYLGATQVEALARRAGAEIEWKPILLGGVLKALWPTGAPFTNAAKARLNLLDLYRWAEHFEVPLRFPPGHPRRTVEAMRLLVAASAEERPALTHRLYAAYWQKGRDLSDRAVLADLAGATLAARLDDPALKDALRIRTDEAIAAGVFGVPTFVVGAQLFWGQDRMAFVERALAGWEVRP